MKRKTKTHLPKIGVIFIVLILALASISITYAGLTANISIHGTVTTGEWGKCFCIRKTLDGSYTDPVTGDDIDPPNYDLNLIHQSDKNDIGFPTKFKLTIEVSNNCNEDLTDVIVTDKIGNQVAPREILEITHGTVIFTPEGLTRQSFGHDDMEWNIGVLPSGETAVLTILIETLKNPSGKYEPTSEHQDIPINDGGAEVTAETSQGDTLNAKTDKITLYIEPYGTSEDDDDNDNLAIIATPHLPHSTPWVCIGDSGSYPCSGE